MAKPYDATSKDLIETDPAGWVAYLGCPVPPSAVRLVDADVSTVTTDADKVIRVDGPEPWLLHLEIQAGWEGAMDRRLLQYNGLLQHRHGLPVASVVVILRPAANMTALSGELPVRPPIGRGWEFRYEVVRVWERPAADFLDGPIGLLPLAPIAAVTPPELPVIVGTMRERIAAVTDRPLTAKLWAATYVLMGLRYDPPVIDNLLSGVMQMEESTTYQAILQRGMQQGIRQGESRGAVLEARKLLLLAGRQKFGTPTPAAEAAVAATSDTVLLESLLTRVFTVNSWDELLAGG